MKAYLIALSIVAVWPLPSGNSFHMSTDPSVPGARGTVNAKRNKKDGNTELAVRVTNMASPSQLTPPENVYVVWIRPKDGDLLKEGILTVGNEKGELKATTSARECDVFITAEQSDSIASPKGKELLRAHVTS